MPFGVIILIYVARGESEAIRTSCVDKLLARMLTWQYSHSTLNCCAKLTKINKIIMIHAQGRSTTLVVVVSVVMKGGGGGV